MLMLLVVRLKPLLVWMAPGIPRSGPLIPALGNMSNLIIDYNLPTLPGH